jgi:AcrR family transcriptional regulator
LLKDHVDVRRTEEADMTVSLGRREAGKAERRQRIIQAARQLIRETGNAGLSMRALAARAGVSLATPYNLFGSKRAIVLAVHQDVREFHQRFSVTRSADPVERIFAAVDMSVDFYVGDPQFYKTLWAAVFDTTDEVRTEILNPKRDAFWLALAQAAAEAGAIAEGVDLDLLVHQLDYMFRSVILDWVVGEMPADVLAPTIRLGYALILKGAASPDWRGPLQARVVDSQALLKRARKPAPAVQ